MYYFLISVAALLFSAQFMFTDAYQKENGTGWNPVVKLTFYTSVIGLIITLIINKFSINFSLFSLYVAVTYSIVCIALNYCTIKTFQYASLSVYTVFSMIGGMALPFVYGLLLGEEFTVVRILCFALIVFSILLLAEKNEKTKKAFPYYIGVFILNGMVGVISKFHQLHTQYCVDSASFLMLTKIVMIFICIGVMLKSKDYMISCKSVIYCIWGAGFNSIANLMLLFALLNLPVSVQYPMVTGGTIVFSTIIDLIRKVKVTKREIAATVISFISACLMAL